MGPITIEGIIGDGALYHADLDCAPAEAHPCDAHGQWACTMAGCPGENCDFGVLYGHDNLDGSECCDRCTMPLDEAAFEEYLDRENAEAHKNGRCAEDCHICEAEAEADDTEPISYPEYVERTTDPEKV